MIWQSIRTMWTWIRAQMMARPRAVEPIVLHWEPDGSAVMIHPADVGEIIPIDEHHADGPQGSVLIDARNPRCRWSVLETPSEVAELIRRAGGMVPPIRETTSE